MADEQPDALTLEHVRTSGGKVKVTARLAGEPKHMDTIDPANASHRKRYAKAVVEMLPVADVGVIEAELMRIADAAKQKPEPAFAPVELDIAHIVRPELFITATVTGLTVPVVIDAGGKPSPRWMQYLHWSDGKRDCRELAECISLPEGSKLWVHPIPGEPPIIATANWSQSARQNWLNGAATPNPAEVFKAVCERIAYFIDLPANVAPGTTATLALWSMLTYVFSAWDAVPYLFIGGPMSSGKSTAFRVLEQLVFRPLSSSNLTAAALFRTIHERGGTLLLDEAERLKQSTPEVGELLSMLLAGYKRGGQATRLEPVGDAYRTVSFDVYGPKALACIAGLPPTLASRSISITMFRAGPDSPKPKRRIEAEPERWKRLRDDLHALALEYGVTWRELAQRSNVCPKGISGRAYELWQPLLALASWLETHGADGLLKLVQNYAVESNDAGKDDQIPDTDETLLEILTDAVKAGTYPTPTDLLNRAKERDNSTFDRWAPRTVSNRLKVYGIVAKKVGGVRAFRTVTLTSLLRIQTNYGIDLGIPTPESASLASPTASRDEILA